MSVTAAATAAAAAAASPVSVRRLGRAAITHPEQPTPRAEYHSKFEAARARALAT